MFKLDLQCNRDTGSYNASDNESQRFRLYGGVASLATPFHRIPRHTWRPLVAVVPEQNLSFKVESILLRTTSTMSNRRDHDSTLYEDLESLTRKIERMALEVTQNRAIDQITKLQIGIQLKTVEVLAGSMEKAIDEIEKIEQTTAPRRAPTFTTKSAPRHFARHSSPSSDEESYGEVNQRNPPRVMYFCGKHCDGDDPSRTGTMRPKITVFRGPHEEGKCVARVATTGKPCSNKGKYQVKVPADRV